MGAARATLTREDSEWSRKFEEPWQSRLRDWRGVEQFLLQGRVKGLAKYLQCGRVEMLLESCTNLRYDDGQFHLTLLASSCVDVIFFFFCNRKDMFRRPREDIIG